MHSRRPTRGILAAALLSVALIGAAGPADSNVRTALDRISAESMKGHVSFLASDLLEGRSTPSRGQDIAAEYIAAQFRRAGLQPAGDDGYFQTAIFGSIESDKTGATVDLVSADKNIPAPMESSVVQNVDAVALSGAPIVKLTPDPAAIEKLRPSDLAGKVAAVYVTRGFGPDAESRYRALQMIRDLKPALMLLTGPGAPRGSRARLIAEDELAKQVPVFAVREGELAAIIEKAPSGTLEWKLDAKLPAAKRTTFNLRNVAATLPGSDPVLRNEYVLVTGHYDHVGVKQQGDGDRIYNGANDDASGTASVIEIAAALAGMNPRPKRSILFIALFGEEMGLLGSEYYGRHPLVPLKSTIADVNLEQMGRTDANDGPKVASATFTGFGFSQVPSIFKSAGEQTGVTVYNDEKRGDLFFNRSDNQALADVGIPAHTICVAFDYSDYHAVGDEWQKIDYDNMAKVNRMVALGLITLANAPDAPRWNEQDPKAKEYADAWRELHAHPAQ